VTRALEALGIDVSAELLAQWATWFAPEHQPFLLSPDSPLARAGRALDSSMTMETRDTFEIYSFARRHFLPWHHLRGVHGLTA